MSEETGTIVTEPNAPGAPPGETLLVARDVWKTYRRGPEEVHALRGVSFAIRPAEVVGLVGPSGSGKTTLLNILCGWEHPDRGELLWEGGPVKPAALMWKDLAIIPQDLGLLEELSVRENVELPLRLAGRLDDPGRDRVTALLEGFALETYEDRAPSEISMGEQQRTALARALILSPALLLADEPTGHQDARWAVGVFRSFRLAASEGTACLVATHSMEGLRHVDRVVGIRDGQIHRARFRRAAEAEG